MNESALYLQEYVRFIQVLTDNIFIQTKNNSWKS